MKGSSSSGGESADFVPRLYSLIAYPMFFCSTRVSVHKSLLRTADGAGSMRHFTAMFSHGRSLYRKYGLFSLYRGADIFFLQYLLRQQTRGVIRRQKTRKSQVLARLALETALYPLALAGARVIAATVGDSREGNLLGVWEDTWKFDGISGFFAGLAPYLLALGAEETGELALRRLRGNFPEMDAMDETVAKISVLAASAVLSAPLLQISLSMRTQSEIPYLPSPQGISDLLAGVDWRVFLLQTAAVSFLCGLNFFVIADKHASSSQDGHDHDLDD